MKRFMDWISSPSAGQGAAAGKAAAGAAAVALGVFVFFCAATYPGAFALLHLAQHGVAVKGVATATDVRNHNLVEYTFELDGRHYAGSVFNHVGAGDGSPITVVVDPSQPSHSCACIPEADAEGLFISPPLFALFIGTAAFVVLWLGTSQLARKDGVVAPEN